MNKALMLQLRKYVKEFDALCSRVHKLRPKIFECAYECVNSMIEDGDVKDIKAGCIKLGNSLKRSYTNIESWYYCGRFMDQEGLEAAKVDANSVRLVYNRRKVLSRATYLRVISMIKQQEPFKDVTRLVNSSKRAAEDKGTRKGKRLQKDAQLTKTRVKLEMHALRTLIQEYAKSDKIRIVVYDGRQKILEVG